MTGMETAAATRRRWSAFSVSGGDAEVGQAVRGGGGRVAAPVEGLEAGPLQQPCGERVEGAGDDEHVAAGEAVA